MYIDCPFKGDRGMTVANKNRELKKVTMNLTESDVANTAFIREVMNTRNNAQAVSCALSFTSELTKLVKDGDELMVRRKNGTMERVLITGVSVS